MNCSGLVGRAGYSSAGGHRLESHRDTNFQMDNVYLDRNVLVNRHWEPAHNMYYIFKKTQTVP